METVIVKFGGSSLEDNIKLDIVANKIITLYKSNKKIVVVVSAQGKTTDELLKQAKELSNSPNKRELDMLLSTGEQVAISKLAIVLNKKGYKAVSLTAMQVGIYTNENHLCSKIESINTSRIIDELEKDNIVIVAGFQGVNDLNDITTLGRGGSDTTALALASSLGSSKCYIYSDVESIYSADPKCIEVPKKIEKLSYREMLELSNEGAKVLHNRCVEIAEKFNVEINTKSTFNENIGTKVCGEIEGEYVKSIVKQDNLYLLSFQKQEDILDVFLNNNICFQNYFNNINQEIILNKENLKKLENIKELEVREQQISCISFIGYGLENNIEILKQILSMLEKNNVEIIYKQIEECKIKIIVKNNISESLFKKLHDEII